MHTPNRVIENACGLPLVLRAAQDAELPAPDEIVVDTDHVAIDLPTLDALDAWATWIEAEPRTLDEFDHAVHEQADGEMFDLPLHLRYVGLKPGVRS